MSDTTSIILAIVGAGGFWTLLQFVIQKLLERRSAQHAAVLGLLHDRVYHICHRIIEQESVTTEEYDNLKYLYEPYVKLGGNGTAKKLKEQVDKLDIGKGERS